MSEALSGRGGNRGVRTVLLEEGRAILQETLQSMIGPGGRLRSCRLRRAHFKPGRKLTGCYDVQLAGTPGPTPVVATWSLDGDAAVVHAQLAAAEEELRRAAFPTPFDRLWAFAPAWGMLVLVAPLDPVFPALGYLSDARAVPAALSSCRVRERDGGGPYVVRPVRYRPGERHVLRYRAPGQPSVYAKLYRPGECMGLAARITALADVVDGRGDSGTRAIRPVDVLSDTGAILYRSADGESVSRQLQACRPEAYGELNRAGRFLRALDSGAPAAAFPFQQWTLDDEVSATHRACEAMAVLRPDLGETARRVVETAREGIATREQEPATLVHGDMKCDHLLVGPGGMTVLDLDRCALADPAFDLGKFLADLRWWSWRGGDPDGAAAAEETLAGYGGSRSRLARARFYAALLLVKVAARRVSVARRDWAPRTARVLTFANQMLDTART